MIRNESWKIKQRLLETAAMMIIGDSVLMMVAPRRHLSLWYGGPRWWKRVCDPFIHYPNASRLLGAVGVGVGIWLARRQEPSLLPSKRRKTPVIDRLARVM